MSEVNLKRELFRLLTSAISDGKANGIILSGGIDSSLLATIASRLRPITGVTVVYKEVKANDLYYSSILSERLRIRHIIKKFGLEEAVRSAEEIVRITKSFDHIAIRNDLTIYLALKTCVDEGLHSVITGDGGDELFAGYDYMTEMSDSELSEYINSLSGVWTFSAPTLARSLGIKAIQPYLDKEVVDFAKRLPYQWRVKRSERVYGKWILRSMLEDLGFPEIAHRNKEPIESGSGSIFITKILLEKLGRDTAKKIEEEALREGIRFWSKEQIYFYKIFKETFGEIPRAKEGEKKCACCGSPLSPNKLNCNVCGFLNRRS